MWAGLMGELRVIHLAGKTPQIAGSIREKLDDAFDQANRTG